MSTKIRSHRELLVYLKALEAAMSVFELSKRFPKEETYSLTDQLRRSFRSVCANLAEAWRKRRYEKSFVSKLSDAEGEAAETQVWLEFAARCGYVPREEVLPLYNTYEEVIKMIVAMIKAPEKWLLPPGDKTVQEEGDAYGEPF